MEDSMKSIQRAPKTLHPFVLGSVFLAAIMGMAITAVAQDVSDLQTPNGSLVLQARGSFFVGGELITADAGSLGQGRPAGQIAINQMYVDYMIPQGGGNKVPVVMIEGGGLSGKSWETTPDGRMGIDEYFVRQGHPVYVVDQVWRGRSGTDVTPFNKVREGILPPATQPNMIRTSAETAWTVFRWGPVFGTAFPDTQFPIDHATEFYKQGVPSFTIIPPGAPDPNYKNLSDLALKLKGAVLMGHSQSALFPMQAALTDSTGIKGLLLTEPPGGCNATTLTDQQIATLAPIPILVEFGDHLDSPPVAAVWAAAFADCQAFIARVNAAGGNAQLLHLPDVGLHGNSHLWMDDKNNLQVGDLILKWIDQNVGMKKTAGK
jgi:pimeloyl-ACP methyl ester carboxylesterase